MAAIELHDLTKRFGDVTAVDGVSLEIGEGTVTGFLGPNGAGKTTTLRMLLGLVRPTSGSATIGGRTYGELPRPMHTVGASLEASSFHPGRTALDHLRVYAPQAGVPDARCREVLAIVGLDGVAKRRVGGYSLGMRQRLALAGALLGDPRALVLDEPANGLDPQGMRWLRDFLRGLASEGRTVLVSSHVLAEVSQLADDVVIINRGRFVAQSSVAEVTARAGGATRVRSPDIGRLRTVLAEAGFDVTSAEDGSLLANAAPERVGEIAAANGVVLHQLVADAATLEEAFIELTGAETRP